MSAGRWLCAPADHAHTGHYDQIVARVGSFTGGFLPRLAAGSGCTEAEAQRVETYFKPRLGQIPGLDRGLAQTHESIMLCSALQAYQNLQSTSP